MRSAACRWPWWAAFCPPPSGAWPSPTSSGASTTSSRSTPPPSPTSPPQSSAPSSSRRHFRYETVWHQSNDLTWCHAQTSVHRCSHQPLLHVISPCLRDWCLKCSHQLPDHHICDAVHVHSLCWNLYVWAGKARSQTAWPLNSKLKEFVPPGVTWIML